MKYYYFSFINAHTHGFDRGFVTTSNNDGLFPISLVKEGLKKRRITSEPVINCVVEISKDDFEKETIAGNAL